ncbi:MAG: lytic transglycosylase domain-containing protein [Rhizobiaceae bacterium]|nr:lytic transglycosylase domain-containing protein [Rhizobiaceae bacterium]
MAASSSPASSQGIEQLLIERVPVPIPRPDPISTGSISTVSNVTGLVASNVKNRVTPVNGTLSQGFSALEDGDINRALGIRAGMQSGSLDRKLLAWAIGISGRDGVKSGTIASIANDLPDWPGQINLANNAERALANELSGQPEIIKHFQYSAPRTVEGAIALALAYKNSGNTTKARTVIAPFWRQEILDRKLEKDILNSVGNVLKREDHRYRMHQLFYNDRVRAAERVAAKAEQVSLAKARAAAIRKSSNARKLILGVAPSSKKDIGYTFARIEYARRSENWPLAKSLLKNAPLDPSLLIDTGEWWVERRIVSRKLSELGDVSSAYEIAANHSAQSASDIIDAEFHAGFYALRKLRDPATARKHFARILDHATIPRSKARGHYWLGRASSGNAAKEHYQKAARYSGTYYGQLAAHALGVQCLSISNPKPTQAERARYAAREEVLAIKRLEVVKQDGLAAAFYRHLAKKLTSPGELALLAADAERKGDFTLSLQVGKIADNRRLAVDTLAWPIGAIPGSAKISNKNRALAYAISRQESTFNKAAVSPANARGLMQLLPGTAKAVARKNGYTYSFKRLTRDAGYNATLGTAYLSEQLKEFDGSYVLTFVAYNAGPRRVGEWIERFGDPRGKPLEFVVDWVEKIPFTETRKYVQRVMENYQVYKARIDGHGLSIATDLTRGRR